MGRDSAVRVDGVDAFRRNVDLVLADGGAEGEKLAVDVREADAVVIDEIERADARTGQRLDRVAADAADAEHRHAASGEFLHGVMAKEQFGSGKLIQHTIILNHIVVGQRHVHQVGQRDAGKIILGQLVIALPDRQRPALGRAGAGHGVRL